MNFLCANANQNQVIIYVVLAVLVIAMLILPYFTQKKRNQQYMDMLSNIRVGDLVKTAGGIIGRVTKITDKGEIKTVILETGSKTDKSVMEFDINSIYCVLKSTKTEEPKEEKVEETKTEEVKENEEKVEEPVVSEEVKTEETKETKTEEKKPAKAKKTTKKSSK